MVLVDSPENESRRKLVHSTRSAIAKAMQLLAILPRRPLEFVDRIQGGLDSRFSSFGVSGLYLPCNLAQAVPALERTLKVDLRCREFQEETADLRNAIADRQLFIERGDIPEDYQAHDADSRLAEFCYSITRALRPAKVLETGVCQGVTSAHILAALSRNRAGELHSVDLPPLLHEESVKTGVLIPPELRSRWRFYRGASRRVLGPLLRTLGQIDIFLHDSLHTHRNMTMEFRCVWPYLRPGGVCIADDLEGNSAFAEWAERSDVESALVIQQERKAALFGVMIKAWR
jgi:predicted O-methyltransferase YrrM